MLIFISLNHFKVTFVTPMHASYFTPGVTIQNHWQNLGHTSKRLRSTALDGIGGFLYPVQNLNLLPYKIIVVICVPLMQRVQQTNLTTKFLSACNRICNSF